MWRASSSTQRERASDVAARACEAAQRKILFGRHPPTHPPTHSLTVQQHALASLPSPSPHHSLTHPPTHIHPSIHPMSERDACAQLLGSQRSRTHSHALPSSTRVLSLSLGTPVRSATSERTRPFVFSLPTGWLFARDWEFTVECSADSVASQTKSHHVYWRRRRSLPSRATARRVDTSSQASRNRSAVELAAIGTDDASSQL